MRKAGQECPAWGCRWGHRLGRGAPPDSMVHGEWAGFWGRRRGWGGKWFGWSGLRGRRIFYVGVTGGGRGLEHGWWGSMVERRHGHGSEIPVEPFQAFASAGGGADHSMAGLDRKSTRLHSSH